LKNKNIEKYLSAKYPLNKTVEYQMPQTLKIKEVYGIIIKFLVYQEDRTIQIMLIAWTQITQCTN
jgi:hypothetical protein